MHRKSDSRDSVSSVSDKARNRQVSSRFMTPSMASTGSLEPGFSSPRETISPVQRKTGFTSSSLADHISDDRRRDREHTHHHDREKAITKTPPRSVFTLTRQRSCKELKNNTNNNDNGSSKENDRPVIAAGSLKHTGKFTIPGKSISSSSTMNGLERLYLDEKSVSTSRRNHPSDSVSTSIESEPGCFSSPTRTIMTSRKLLGREVSSNKYITMSDNALAKRAPTRWTSDSDIISNHVSFDESMMSTMNKKFNAQKGSSSSSIKRASSGIGYKSSMSQWALSPGRSWSPTTTAMSMESKERPLSFSSLRPHNKSMEKILSVGFDLFRTSKSSSPSRFSNFEDVHALRLLDNQLLQWRFTNARAQFVNENVSHQAESNLICALDTITKLRHSVMQKKIQLEKEKLKMKLNFVLHSQMKLLETWGGMERLHLPTIAVMKECLQSVVCKVPLLEGVKVDIESASDAQQYAHDLTASMKSLLTSFSPSAGKTAEMLSELAEVVAQEKLLLDEFYDLFQTLCVLQLKERNLKCSLIQLQY